MTIYICVYGDYNPNQPRISRLSNSLKEAGHKVVYIVSGKTNNYSDVVSVKTNSKLAFILKTPTYLRKLIKPNDYVMGYVHAGGLAAFLSTLNKKTKFVYEYPDPWVGWYHYKTKTDNLKWKIGRLLFSLVEKIMYKKAYFVTTASQSQLKFLIKQHGPKSNSLVILNCPDIKIFNPKNKDKKLKKKLKLKTDNIAIFLGNIVDEYGCKTIINSFKIVIKKIPNAILLFLGKSKPEYKKELEDLIKENNLQEHIYFLKPVLHKEVPTYLNLAIMGLVPFKNIFYNNVGGPNKLFEYMSCGLVPVVSNMLEFRNYISNKKNGVLVTPESPQAFANAIIQIFKNKYLKKSFGKINLDLVKKQYNWDFQKKKFLKIFQDK